MKRYNQCMNISQQEAALLERFRHGRRHPRLAVLEGLHAVKHALRFGAVIKEAVTDQKDVPLEIARQLAPDTVEWLRSNLKLVSSALFERLVPVTPSSRVIAIAERSLVDVPNLLRRPRRAPVILLERPTNLGNLGAVVRVAAAVGAEAVLTTGHNDPWHPVAIRGSAGLHYAISVGRCDASYRDLRHIVAIDPEGEGLVPGMIPDDSVVAFGSERTGLSDQLRAAATHRVGIPMEQGVSSLNLATSVAVVMYVWRLTRAT